MRIVKNALEKEITCPHCKSKPTPKVSEEPTPLTKEDENLINKFQDFSNAKGTINVNDKKLIMAYLTATDEERQVRFFNYIKNNYGADKVDDLSEIQGKDLVSSLREKGKA